MREIALIWTRRSKADALASGSASKSCPSTEWWRGQAWRGRAALKHIMAVRSSVLRSDCAGFAS
eukprot:scaffold85169_cov34-Phaeocystis_antarctica.AAC.3